MRGRTRGAGRRDAAPPRRAIGGLRAIGLVGVAAAALAASACTSSSSPSAAPGTTAGATSGTAARGSGGPVTTVVRPAGPAADVATPLTGGNGVFLGESAAAATLAPGSTQYGEAKMPAGYVQQEYLATGTATDYKAQGELGGDGRWTFAPDTSADYRTRVVVRRPEDPAKASGTVVVEWLNVSGGIDANPDWASFSDELVRRGDTWVGVSAQKIGIEGGPVLVAVPGFEDLVGKGLKAMDPARYGTLAHPGDGYAFDIYTQVARAVRAGGPLLGGITPEVVLAAGESQSAIALTTYYNGVQPLTKAFDGFFVHSRAYAGLPLVAPGQAADLAGAMTQSKPTTFRTDLAAPVLDLQAESDVIGVLGSYTVRQPDSDTFRLWEVAGTAHADQHLLGPVASNLSCGAPVNAGPMYLVANAALGDLDTWVRTGQAPPTAPRLEVTTGAGDPAIARDQDGIALGGIRTPPVDVPVQVLSGASGGSPALICILLGSTRPLDPARIAARYPSRSAYEQQYAEATAKAIEAGFLLEADREAIKAFSDPSLVG